MARPWTTRTFSRCRARGRRPAAVIDRAMAAIRVQHASSGGGAAKAGMGLCAIRPSAPRWFGGLRAGPGRSHATRSGQTGSAPSCLAPRLLQTTPHIAWELGFFSESAAGGKTGGRLSGKERDSFRLARKLLRVSQPTPGSSSDLFKPLSCRRLTVPRSHERSSSRVFSAHSKIRPSPRVGVGIFVGTCRLRALPPGELAPGRRTLTGPAGAIRLWLVLRT